MCRLYRSRSMTSFSDEGTCPELGTRWVRVALFAAAPALVVSSALSALFGMG